MPSRMADVVIDDSTHTTAAIASAWVTSLLNMSLACAETTAFPLARRELLIYSQYPQASRSAIKFISIKHKCLQGMPEGNC